MSDHDSRRSMDDVLTSLRRIMGSKASQPAAPKDEPVDEPLTLDSPVIPEAGGPLLGEKSFEFADREPEPLKLGKPTVPGAPLDLGEPVGKTRTSRTIDSAARPPEEPGTDEEDMSAETALEDEAAGAEELTSDAAAGTDEEANPPKTASADPPAPEGKRQEEPAEAEAEEPEPTALGTRPEPASDDVEEFPPELLAKRRAARTETPPEPADLPTADAGHTTDAGAADTDSAPADADAAPTGMDAAPTGMDAAPTGMDALPAAEAGLPARLGEAPAAPAGAVDRAELEEMIRRIIREELVQGETGQNISRNVVRLIRQEVERNLSRRGL